MVREFATDEDAFYVPYQLVVHKLPEEDPRFLPRAPKPLIEEFPCGCRGFFLAPKMFGALVQVEGYIDDNALKVKAIVSPQPPTHKALNGEERRYLSAHLVAKKLAISTAVLGRLTSHWYTKPSAEKKNRVLAGLAWRSEKRKEAALGLVKRSSNLIISI